MPRYVAFLRAINVGGRTVKMEELRKHFEVAGYTDVRTLIASGNVVFETKTTNKAKLETTIEAMLKKSLGYEVATFIRTPQELAEIVARSAAKLTDAAHQHIAFLKSATSTDTLAPFVTETDSFHAEGREIHWFCQTRTSDSKFSGAVLEKTLRQPATFRNITTVRKLAELP